MTIALGTLLQGLEVKSLIFTHSGLEQLAEEIRRRRILFIEDARREEIAFAMRPSRRPGAFVLPYDGTQIPHIAP